MVQIKYMILGLLVVIMTLLISYQVFSSSALSNLGDINATNVTIRGQVFNITSSSVWIHAGDLNVSSGNINVTAGIVRALNFTGNLTWTEIFTYPVACPVGSFVTNISDVITCTTLGNMTLNATFQDDVNIGFGNGSEAKLLWETADANANELLLTLPTGGAIDVPVFVIGDASAYDKDLGFFNGITQPAIALLDNDETNFLTIQMSDIHPVFNMNGAGNFLFRSSSSTYHQLAMFGSGENVFNEQQIDIDTRMESDNLPSMFHLDAANDGVGIGRQGNESARLIIGAPFSGAEKALLMTDNSTHTMTAAQNTQRFTNLRRPVIAGAFTVINASTFYINNAPNVTGGAIITNNYSMWVDDGEARFDNYLVFDDTGIAPTATKYQLGRDLQGINNLHLNVPLTAGYNFTVNNTQVIGIAPNTMVFANLPETDGGSPTSFDYSPGAHGSSTATALANAGVSDFVLNLNRIVNFTGGAIGSNITTVRSVVINPSTLTAGSNLNITNASTLYIGGAPTASTGMNISNRYAIYVNDSNSYFGGNMTILGHTVSQRGYSTQIISLANQGANLSTYSAGLIRVATGVAPANLTLPPATFVPGIIYTIKRASAGANPVELYVNSSSGDTIDGQNNVTLYSQYDTVTVVSTGATGWAVTNRDKPSG